jgi:hypothetical protein
MSALIFLLKEGMHMSKMKEWYCKHQNAIKIGTAVGIGGLLGFGAGYLFCVKMPHFRPGYIGSISLKNCDAKEFVVRRESVSKDLPAAGLFENVGTMDQWWATSSPANGTATYAMLNDIPIEKCGELGAKYSEAAQKCGYGAVDTIGYLFMCSESKGEKK